MTSTGLSACLSDRQWAAPRGGATYCRGRGRRDLNRWTLDIGAAQARAAFGSSVAPTSNRVPSSRTARCRARERLVRVEESGYEVVLAWPDEDWDGAISFDRLKYSREAQQGILEYLHRNGTR